MIRGPKITLLLKEWKFMQEKCRLRREREREGNETSGGEHTVEHTDVILQSLYLKFT